MNRVLTKLRKGFTLIELMIVVAIIGILAAIAIPNFIRYQLTSKTSEARTVIGGIKTSMEAFRADYDEYPDNAGGIDLMPLGTGIRNSKLPWVPSACDPACARGTAITACTQYECMGYRPNGPVYYLYGQNIAGPNSGGGSPDYTITALADLDADTIIGGWQFGTNNVTAGTTPALGEAGGVTGCTNDGTGPPGEVYNCAPNQF
jgi:type IV pilus assembly protein PilA